ncbi:hypothetical protein ACFQX7_10115 [Luedemannella flava]
MVAARRRVRSRVVGWAPLYLVRRRSRPGICVAIAALLQRRTWLRARHQACSDDHARAGIPMLPGGGVAASRVGIEARSSARSRLTRIACSSSSPNTYICRSSCRCRRPALLVLERTSMLAGGSRGNEQWPMRLFHWLDLAASTIRLEIIATDA